MRGRSYHLDRTLEHVHPTAFVAHTAAPVGDVTIGQNSSVWFSAIIRGDLSPVTIGDNCSVQDGAVIHVDEDAPTVIGNQVTIGQGVIVHGCEIGDKVLIGIRSVVLSCSPVASNCIIGACTLITEGMRIPANSLVVGTPGKVIKTVTVEHEGHLRYMWGDLSRLADRVRTHVAILTVCPQALCKQEQRDSEFPDDVDGLPE